MAKKKTPTKPKKTLKKDTPPKGKKPPVKKPPPKKKVPLNQYRCVTNVHVEEIIEAKDWQEAFDKFGEKSVSLSQHINQDNTSVLGPL